MVPVKFVLVTLVSILILNAGPLKVSADDGGDGNSPAPAPPSHFKKVAIVGVVFCTSENSSMPVNYTEATPIPGALVRIACSGQWGYYQNWTVSGDNGYFYSEWEYSECFNPTDCTVYLDYSPDPSCKDKRTEDGAQLYLVDHVKDDFGYYSPGVVFYLHSST